ncbi:MAG: hypothetical protein U0Z44_07525 [Kouleothrix sp.]
MFRYQAGLTWLNMSALQHIIFDHLIFERHVRINRCSQRVGARHIYRWIFDHRVYAGGTIDITMATRWNGNINRRLLHAWCYRGDSPMFDQPKPEKLIQNTLTGIYLRIVCVLRIDLRCQSHFNAYSVILRNHCHSTIVCLFVAFLIIGYEFLFHRISDARQCHRQTYGMFTPEPVVDFFKAMLAVSPLWIVTPSNLR